VNASVAMAIAVRRPHLPLPVLRERAGERAVFDCSGTFRNSRRCPLPPLSRSTGRGTELTPPIQLVAIVSILMAALAGPASAATSNSAPNRDAALPASVDRNSIAATKDELESTPIRRRTDSAAPSTESLPVRPGGMEMGRLVGALGLVIGLILLLRWGSQKLMRPGHGRSSRVIQVLSEATITPRSKVLLVRVGRRVIVVGDSGTQMSPLAEITDADEVAALVGQLRDTKFEMSSQALGSLFRRSQDEDDEGPATQTETFDANHDQPIHEAEHPAIAGTRQELSGLAEKVRMMSKSLRGK
jgi:flagellar biogenesis protein FliO